ncbi:MAG: hypothetical protein HDS18_03705 [Bacteroides sp.]|nr:hypothetical protein [Bacteroides sp.]
MQISADHGTPMLRGQNCTEATKQQKILNKKSDNCGADPNSLSYSQTKPIRGVIDLNLRNFNF